MMMVIPGTVAILLVYIRDSWGPQLGSFRTHYSVAVRVRVDGYCTGTECHGILRYGKIYEYSLFVCLFVVQYSTVPGYSQDIQNSTVLLYIHITVGGSSTVLYCISATVVLRYSSATVIEIQTTPH